MNAIRSFKTISEVHDAFDRRDLSAKELVQEFLSRAKASKGGEFLEIAEMRALKQALIADQILSKLGKVPRMEMPLLGIPIGIKDNIATEGVRTTCASKILENYIPPYSATAVVRLERAGAISIGKMNLDEFAMGGSNENSAFGPVRHPTHPDRVPGGSSGGSAAAVRAGLCVAALGSDTGGSIRLPASYCGVVGFKPSYGRVSRYGLIAFASSLDQIGPLTTSVEDAAAVMQVIAGHDPLDSTCDSRASKCSLIEKTSWNGLRIGIPKEYISDGVSKEVAKSIEQAIKSFEATGAKVIPVSLPHTKYAVSVYYLIAVSEASSNLARYDGIRFGSRSPEADCSRDLNDYYKKIRAQFGSEVKRRIILGTFALSSGYAEAYYGRACKVRQLIQQDFCQAFNEADFMAGPVAPTTAFKIGEKISDPLQMYLNDIFTVPASLAGIPAISLPCGQDRDGLPIGLQLLAPKGQDERLLTFANFWMKERSS